MGDGDWRDWNGSFVAEQGGENIGALRLYNRRAATEIVGQARPGEYVTGLPAAALGEVVSLAAVGTLEDSVLTARWRCAGTGCMSTATARSTSANNSVRTMRLELDWSTGAVRPGPRLPRHAHGGDARRAVPRLHRAVRRSTSARPTSAARCSRTSPARHLTVHGERWIMPLDMPRCSASPAATR
jgi:hypothetical protein